MKQLKITNYELRIKQSKGQVAIIVLLVSAIMLSLGLSMSKKEVVDVKIATNDELLKKAFDAAESGINYYLGTGGTDYASPAGDSFAKITATNIGVGQTVDFGEYVPNGSSESYWLVDHIASGDLGTSYLPDASVDVCGVGFSGLVEVNYFYKIGASYYLRRNMYDLNSSCATVDTSLGLSVLLSVTPVINGGKFYISANNGGTFASQGVDVSSLGQAGGTQAGANAQADKKLNIRQRYKVPGFMTSGMVAEGSILSD